MTKEEFADYLEDLLDRAIEDGLAETDILDVLQDRVRDMTEAAGRAG